jgi:hypothetical protein
MEDWQFDFQWLALRHRIRDLMSREQLPDLNALLLLVGVQESGQVRASFTKEEKQDLMHVAVCHLLSLEGYFAFVGRDADGWPHYELVRTHDTTGIKTQEAWLKRLLIKYFQEAELLETP